MAKTRERKMGARSWRRRLAAAIDRRQVIHLLHLGKTGGTALADAVARVNGDPRAPVRFVKYGHKVKRADLPPGEPFVFAVRDPIARFYSGFYSRKRKGQPRTYVEWTPGEAAAFAAFPHAEELAAALFTDGRQGVRALDAMRAIRHVRDFQIDWFDDLARLFDVEPPLAILRQHRLRDDFEALLAATGVATPAALPEDALGAHRNDYRDCPPLSPPARANLARWYAADLQFVALAEAWAARRRGETAARADLAPAHG